MKNKSGLKSFIIVICFILLVFLGFYIYMQYKEKQIPTTSSDNTSLSYDYLTNYLKSQNFKCNNLKDPGSYCERISGDNTYRFYRFEDGVQYQLISKNYSINLLNRSNDIEISIETFNNAFDGYQNKKYTCTTDNDTIIGNVVRCVANKKEVLDNEVYLTAIKTMSLEVADILDHSGYSTSKLLTLYKWEK